jgi:DNA repair protein RadC
MTVNSRGLEVVQGLFILGKHYLTKEEVIKLFLATNNEGRTVFQMAGEFM